MNKIFTTLALAAVAALPTLAENQGRIQMWAPYVPAADGVTVEVLQDFKPDNEGCGFYIWDGGNDTFTVKSGSDAIVGDYNIFSIIPGKGWLGGGMMTGKRDDGATPLKAGLMDDQWRLHFMWKANMAPKEAIILRTGPTVGQAEIQLKYTAETPGAKFDNTWNTVDIPVTDLLDMLSLDEEDYKMFFRNWYETYIWSLTVAGAADGYEVALADLYYYKDGYISGVEGVASDAEVVAEEYYSFDGIKMAEAPVKGLYIVKKTLADGTVKTVKVAK